MRGQKLAWLALACICLAPGQALAQYKNTIFGFDLGATLGADLGTLVDPSQPSGVVAPGNRNMRLKYGERLGLQVGLKMHSDHWWWVSRLNLHFYQFNSPDISGGALGLDDQADYLAAQNIGTTFGLQPQTGIRYTFLTDNVRPYLQLALAYMHIFTLKSSAGSTCNGNAIGYACTAGGTYGQEFLPHQNIISLNLEPGIEIILSRDVALHLMLDYQRWLFFFNGPDGNYFTLGLGLTFFS